MQFMNFPFTPPKGSVKLALNSKSIRPRTGGPFDVCNSNICQFFGSHLCSSPHGPPLPKSSGFFLDKICINQTDQKRKLAGIQAIDQFILRSKTMLICYNDVTRAPVVHI